MNGCNKRKHYIASNMLCLSFLCYCLTLGFQDQCTPWNTTLILSVFYSHEQTDPYKFTSALYIY